MILKSCSITCIHSTAGGLCVLLVQTYRYVLIKWHHKSWPDLLNTSRHSFVFSRNDMTYSEINVIYECHKTIGIWDHRLFVFNILYHDHFGCRYLYLHWCMSISNESVILFLRKRTQSVDFRKKIHLISYHEIDNVHSYEISAWLSAPMHSVLREIYLN